MADLGDLATYMDRLNAGSSNYIARYGSDVAVAMAVAILLELTQTTPADIGVAVSNWIVTLGEPSEDVLPAFVPSPKGHTVKGRWQHRVDPTQTREANAPDVMEAAQTVLAAKQPGQTIFITNSVEYIQQLEAGSSEQAPAGFVERAEIIGQQVIDRANVIRSGGGGFQ